MDVYQQLSALLTFDEKVRGPILSALNDLKSQSAGIGVSKSVATLQAAVAKAESCQQAVDRLRVSCCQGMSHMC